MTPIFIIECDNHDKMQLFTKFKKKILWRGFRAPYVFENVSPSYILSCKSSKLKLREFIAGHIVAIITCYIKRMTAICLPVIGHLYMYDTIIVIFILRSVQNVAVRKVLETVASLLKHDVGMIAYMYIVNKWKWNELGTNLT